MLSVKMERWLLRLCWMICEMLQPMYFGYLFLRLNTHQLKITCSWTGKRTRYTQGMCEPAAWRPRVSANLPEPGGVGGQSSAPLPSPERVSFLPPSCFWRQFAQGRYRLCSFQSLDIACFHRETNIKRTEAVWTVQEGQSWGNYSYPTGVQTLSHSQLNP